MKTEWKSFLTDAGAEYDAANDTEVLSFGNPEREKRYTLTGNVVCDLTHLGLIEVQGEDALTFLQGQTTNDVSLIEPTTSQPGSYCNPKGRILASYRMFRRGDSYFLMLPEEMVAQTVKRLRMFVLMSKVTIVDASASLVRFGVSGPDSAAEVESILGAAPADVNQVVTVSGVTVVRVDGTQPRFIVLSELAEAKTLWDKFNVRGAPAGGSSWRLMDIVAGYPNVYPATKEAFVPQMVNLELLDGVSFKKGCYTGQEIVARMHYLGKLKRRMYQLHFDSDGPVEPGTALFSVEDKTGQPIGTVVDSAPSPDGGVEALAVLTIKYAAAESSVNLESLSGRQAFIHLPPYDLEAKVEANES